MQKIDLPLLEDADITPGSSVIVRVDFNVPIFDGKVRDSFRINRSLRTIDYLRAKGAKIILISHITGADSLQIVSDFLQDKVPHIFIRDFTSEDSRERLQGLGNGEVALLENLRITKGEEENNEDFARSLAALASVYVNDAFSVSHRKHASIVGLPQFLPSFAGFLLAEEIQMLERALNPEKPLLFVLGGAKFETKLPLVERFLNIADTIVLGGALANDVYKAKGLNVGTSLVSDADIANIMNSEKVVVPSEVIVLRENESRAVSSDRVLDHDLISDAAPEWTETLQAKISSAKTILWNGPLGNYEAGFSAGSEKLAKLIAAADGFSIIGGGDTVALVDELGLVEKFNFISTGGGAMLDFLSSGTLPGIEMLKNMRYN